MKDGVRKGERKKRHTALSGEKSVTSNSTDRDWLGVRCVTKVT